MLLRNVGKFISDYMAQHSNTMKLNSQGKKDSDHLGSAKSDTREDLRVRRDKFRDTKHLEKNVTRKTMFLK
jgi:hypothetical protein